MTYTEVQNTLVVGKSSLSVNPRPGPHLPHGVELVKGGDSGQRLGALTLGVQRVAGVHIAGQLGEAVLGARHLRANIHYIALTQDYRVVIK